MPILDAQEIDGPMEVDALMTDARIKPVEVKPGIKFDLGGGKPPRTTAGSGGVLVLATPPRRSAVAAVMALVLTFFGLAALYTLLSAHFLAAIQVLVYAGAIMTLFVFVVMVLNREEQEPWALRGVVTKAIGAAVVSGG